MNLVNFVKEIIVNDRIQTEKIYNEYIESSYTDIKNIYEDLIKILFHVKYGVERKKLTVQEAIEYIEDSRIPFKAIRRQLSSKIVIAFFNKKVEEDIFMFALGIRGILQGGMTGVYADNISSEIKKYVKTIDFSERSLMLYQGNHTLTDLVDYFNEDNPKSIYYVDEKLQYKKKDDYIKEKFLDSVDKQISSVEEYWILTTLAYERVKYDKLIY